MHTRKLAIPFTLIMALILALPTLALQPAGVWQQVNTPSIPGNLDGHSMVTIGNNAYLFGGHDADADGLPWQDSIYEININTPGGWVKLSPNPRPPARANHAATVVDGKMIIHGGMDGTNVLGDAWVYDPQANTWTKSTSSGPARTHHSAVVSNGKMYIVGGTESGGLPSAEVWAYDTAASSWTKETDYPGPPGGAYGTAVFAPDSTIMVGGTTGNDYYVYDPNTNTWTPKTATSSPPERVSPGTSQVGDYGYIFGGEDTATGEYRTDTWKADLTQDPVQWEPEPPDMPNAKAEVCLIPEAHSPTTPGWMCAFPNADTEPAVLLYGRSWTYKPGSHTPILGDAATFLFWPGGSAAGELAGVTVWPTSATVEVSQQHTFNATGRDAQGFYVPITPTWSATGGSITAFGQYAAGDLPGNYAVHAAVGTMAGSASVEVSGTATCPDLTPGESYTHTFTVSGTYPYYDGHATDHKGTVVVSPTVLALSPAKVAALDAPNATRDVSITADGFEPPTVTISLNDIVRWTNNDTATHAVNGGEHRYTLYLPLVLKSY